MHHLHSRALPWFGIQKSSQPLYTLLPGHDTHDGSGNDDGGPGGPANGDGNSGGGPGGDAGGGHAGPEGTGDAGRHGAGSPDRDGHPGDSTGHGADSADQDGSGDPDREGNPGADDGPGTDGGPGGDADDGPGTDGNCDHPGGDGDGGGGGDGPAGGNRGGTRRPGPGDGSGPPGGWLGPGSGQALPPGLAGSVNLTIPLATWLGLTSRPGEAAGHGPLDADTSRGLAAFLAGRPANPWCLTILDPAGRAIGHGCARAGPGPPGPGSHPHTWLAGVKIRWLETGACGHARETFTYQPSPILRRLVKTRNRTCCFPGCRWSARRCDDDHTVPFDQGGRTCECNLAPLCRRHHAAKQAPGWHLSQPQPGHLSWTLPSGRTRTITPSPYPT